VSESRDVEFRWRASQLTRAIATCAAVALAAAVIGARWQLIAFAAPLLGVLCSISWQHPVPKVRVQAGPDSQRCFELEPARVTVSATEEAGAAQVGSAIELSVAAPEGMQLEVHDSDTAHAKTVVATAQRWGRYFIQRAVGCWWGPVPSTPPRSSFFR